jgi:adenylate cyclase
MAAPDSTEIERKFLLKSDAWRAVTDGPGMLIRQGYLARGTCTVRVRVKGDAAWITVKGTRVGASRPEFEYEISSKDAQRMLDSLCEKPLIEKTRYLVKAGECVFEIDEFHGANAGLVLAEVELERED